MPVRIERRENEWCTIEPSGKVIACFPTEEAARRQQIAIEANKALILPGSKGLRHMFLISSNAFRDREGEIVRSDGLREYAEGKTFIKPEDNDLLFWHEGDAIGKIIYAEFYKSFLIEVARELPDQKINLKAGTGEKPIITSVKTVWDNIEHLAGIWRSSIGFRAMDKSKDGVLYPIEKHETSVVIEDYQANWWTISEVI
jgi:hypothetical protein